MLQQCETLSPVPWLPDFQQFPSGCGRDEQLLPGFLLQVIPASFPLCWTGYAERHPTDAGTARYFGSDDSERLRSLAQEHWQAILLVVTPVVDWSARLSHFSWVESIGAVCSTTTATQWAWEYDHSSPLLVPAHGLYEEHWRSWR